ncbi:hypothetical protein MAA5396_02272 [Marinovum algicola]|uniref:Uncharacterized protein n=1 Tax=Marinovum algicola TaxID=42444 RepID=A0A975W9A1_9RHOB|nr:hypothetical protein SAMN04487940_104284 [Marinovum algicola]SLN46278.1 hypothetical protein MAA5396_02272 [Marinovum algicola]
MHPESMINERSLSTSRSVNEDDTTRFSALGEGDGLGNRNPVPVALKKAIEMIAQRLVAWRLYVGVTQVIHEDLDGERGIGLL